MDSDDSSDIRPIPNGINSHSQGVMDINSVACISEKNRIEVFFFAVELCLNKQIYDSWLSDF